MTADLLKKCYWKSEDLYVTWLQEVSSVPFFFSCENAEMYIDINQYYQFNAMRLMIYST